ncbi:MAG: TonB-dependent receptor [Rhodospirillaceae bacterium]
MSSRVIRIFATGSFTLGLLGGGLLDGELNAVSSARADETAAIPEIVITGSREGQLRTEIASSITVIGREDIENIHPLHPSDLLGRVPGVTVQPTNGEGHMTGIRQPVGTSAVYLYLEDGVPVRASGFYNHNALYEVNLPQSGGVEVIRGPGTALYGSDAIGGIVNSITRKPAVAPEAGLTLEAGSFGWLRALGAASGTWDGLGLRADVNVTHSDGWRDATAYDRQSLTLRADVDLAGGHLKTVLSATNIDQQTGANSALSAADYTANPVTNYYPIAFRAVQSVRGSFDWEKEAGASLVSVIPYFRWSVMDLLPTFTLTFDPMIYTTGYSSAGLMAKVRYDVAPWRTRIIAGVDLDYSPGFRREDRIAAVRNGKVYSSYTNAGRIYDYDVTFWQASSYGQIETSPVSDLRVTAGMRFDVLGYKYDNRLSNGAFATSTPFGPRTFFRPADSEIDFRRVTPSFGATYQVARALNLFASYKQSFRIPQESQMFRPGATSDSLALKPIVADSYEVGIRGSVAALDFDLSAYRMIKRNDILTLTTGAGPAQTNNGRTRHQGLEASVAWRMTPQVRLTSAIGFNDHVYRHWVVDAATDLSGKEISAAPAVTANTTLEYTPAWSPHLRLEAEWSRVGSYWMDDLNTQSYGGYDLVNLRASYTISEGVDVFGRVSNLLDTRWSTASTVSNGVAQFSPGLPRTAYIGLMMRF